MEAPSTDLHLKTCSANAPWWWPKALPAVACQGGGRPMKEVQRLHKWPCITFSSPSAPQLSSPTPYKILPATHSELQDSSTGSFWLWTLKRCSLTTGDTPGPEYSYKWPHASSPKSCSRPNRDRPAAPIGLGTQDSDLTIPHLSLCLGIPRAALSHPGPHASLPAPSCLGLSSHTHQPYTQDLQSTHKTGYILPVFSVNT